MRKKIIRREVGRFNMSCQSIAHDKISRPSTSARWPTSHSSWHFATNPLSGSRHTDDEATASMKTPAERGPVPISGYLHKMKAKERLLTPQWNKRFFALEGVKLKYYQHENSPEASKVIDLLGIESIRRFENGDHGVYSFVVKTPERSYFLRAESKGDMKRWVRGLKDQQDLWRAKQEKGTALPDPAVRRPKHYSDIPLVPQTSSGSLRA